MKAAVFLERDGVLNQVRVVGRNQVPPMRLEDFQVREEVREPLAQLKAAGYLLFVTTNQPSVGRGVLPRRELDRMHDHLRRALPIDDVLLCPHEESDRCSCRKPGAALFTEAAFRWHLDMERSFVISDKWQDAAAAFVAGCNSVLIQSPWSGSGHHDFLVRDLDEACQKILQFGPPLTHAAERRELAFA
ncbi:MAG: D-glycero-beta-D-manno-heptose,7-bisphosphate 7-phosphatase [Verrucomicrobiota bacterium]|jgi:D-glycero-D-manno-heptose 1,7-bisphosphate phosphatase